MKSASYYIMAILLALSLNACSGKRNQPTAQHTWDDFDCRDVDNVPLEEKIKDTNTGVGPCDSNNLINYSDD